MSIEQEKRVLWRVQELNKKTGKITTLLATIERAIMEECGTNRLTLKSHITALKKLGWIKRLDRWRWWYKNDL